MRNLALAAVGALTFGLCLAAVPLAQPDDAGLFPFVIRPDAADSVMDMSALLQTPAGRDGFLRRDGEHFRDGKGRVVRLNGVNLTGGANFPQHDEADRLATHFARLGFNCVRLHLFDQIAYGNCFQDLQPCLFRADPSGRVTVIDEEMRDRFEYLIAALKRRGVYVNVNLHAGHQFGPADGIRKTPWANRGVDMFDRQIIVRDKAFFRELLRHVNPHTGLALADDPAVALLEINNENGLMQVWWSQTIEKQGADPDYLADFHRLRAAAGYNATTNGINKFIIEVEKAYFREMRMFLKGELGVKCPVYGTQLDYTAPWVMADTCEAIDIHIYWTHPRWTNPPGTDGRQGRAVGVPWWFVNKPLVSAGLTNGWNMEHVIAGRGTRRVKGLPFITSECAAPYPNWYGAEYQPTIHAYAAFQDWAGVFVYSWNNEHKAFPDHNPFFFSHAARPDCLAHFPAACAMFLRGDVSTAKRRIDVAVERASRFPLATHGYVPVAVVDADSGSGGRVTNDVFLRHAVGVDLCDGPVSESDCVASVTNGMIACDTDEIVLHRADGKSGWFRVNTPNVRFLAGFLDGQSQDLGGVVFAPGCTKLGWCALSLVSQTGNGLRPGARLLLAATGYTHNGGAVFHHQKDDAWGGVVEELGSGKVVTEGVPLTVTLPVAQARCWALDESGARKTSVPTAERGGRVEITVGPAYRTVWYEISL